MKFFISITLFFSLFSSFYAQNILNNTLGITYYYELPFVSKTIKKHRIRSIQTQHMHKKELQMLAKDTNLSSYYEFNNHGQQVMYYQTYLLFHKTYDTLVRFYQYDDSGRLETLRKSEYGSFGVYQYTYKNGKIVRLNQAIEENALNSKTAFIPKTHTPQYTEYYTYQQMDSLSYIKYTLSQDSVRFKEEEFLYENGLLKQTQNRLLFSKQKHVVINYAYFEKDLIKKEMIDFYSGKVLKQYIYRYNEKKQLIGFKIHQGKDQKNVLVSCEFLYNEKDLLSAILYKDEKTKIIDIVKFNYEFY